MYTYKRSWRPLADSTASASVSYKDWIMKTFARFVLAMVKNRIGKQNYLYKMKIKSITQLQIWMSQIYLFEEQYAQTKGLRNCHQYQSQWHPSMLSLWLQPINACLLVNARAWKGLFACISNYELDNLQFVHLCVFGSQNWTLLNMIIRLIQENSNWVISSITWNYLILQIGNSIQLHISKRSKCPQVMFDDSKQNFK